MVVMAPPWRAFGQLPYQICEGMSAIAAPLACLDSVFLTIIYIPPSAVNTID